MANTRMRINSFVDRGALDQGHIILSPEESHHLVRVLRVQPGEEITLFDGHGGVATAILDHLSKTGVEARILKSWTVPPPPVRIDLIQALPKPDRWELVIQKAVELGVSNIYPVLTQRTEFKDSVKKRARWDTLALNAAQQCEVRWIPKLHAVDHLSARLPSFEDYDQVLVGSLYEGAQRFRDLSLDGVTSIALLIGPEGDFTSSEMEHVVAAGARPISFGNRILRTETASIFGLSVLAYKLL